MLQGCWSIENEIVAVTRADAAELLDGLSRLEASDLAEHCADYTIEECIRCATVLRDFIGKVLIRGETLLIEDD